MRHKILLSLKYKIQTQKREHARIKGKKIWRKSIRKMFRYLYHLFAFKWNVFIFFFHSKKNFWFFCSTLFFSLFLNRPFHNVSFIDFILIYIIDFISNIVNICLIWIITLSVKIKIEIRLFGQLPVKEYILKFNIRSSTKRCGISEDTVITYV